MRKFTTKRALSILLAVCMLVSLLPVGMMAGAISTDLNNGNAIYRYNQHLLTIKSAGSASVTHDIADVNTIWKMAMGHSEYMPPEVHPTGAGPANELWVGPYETDEVDDFYSKKAEDLATDPYAIVDWSTATTPGVTVGGGVINAAGAWYSMKILVPSSGNYTAEAQFYAYSPFASSVDMYMVKAEDYVKGAPLVAENLVGTFSGTNVVPAGVASAYDALYTLADSIYLDAGEYVVTYTPGDGKAFYGGSLTLIGDAEPTEVITLAYDESVLNVDGQLEVPAGGSADITITGEDSWGELDTAYYETARVDCGSDAISATYADGVITVSASRLDADPVTSATLLFATADAAAWIEIPVKVVPGSERILTLGHTGATDNMQVTLPNSIQMTAKIDGEDMEIIEEDEISVEIVDADGNDASDAVTADVSATGAITFTAAAAGSYTAKVSAVIDGVANKTAYEIPLTVSAIEVYYNYMKSLANATVKAVPSGGKQLNMNEWFADYALTMSGASRDMDATIQSGAWKIGPSTAGGSSQVMTNSATAWGMYWIEKNIGDYVSYDLYLPYSGNFTITSHHTPWATGGMLDLYLAPAGAEDPFAEEYKLNAEPVNCKDATIHKAQVEIATKDLDAGEYTLYYKSLGNADGSAISGGYWFDGVKFTLNGDVAGTKAYIDMPKHAVNVAVGGNVTIAAKVLPAALADQSLTWESANDDIATVSGGVVTGVANGITTITATSDDGASKSVTVLVGAPAYNYDFLGVSLATVKGDVSSTALYQNGYAASRILGSGQWFYADASSTGVSGAPYLQSGSWATTMKYQGILTTYQNNWLGGSYVRFQVKVTEDGVYQIISNEDVGGLNVPTEFHFAPVDAENPVADEYKIGELVATRNDGPVNGTAANVNGTDILVKEVELKAGDYYFTKTSLPIAGGTYSSYTADIGTSRALKLYKVANLSEVDVATVSGAQIRTSGKQGLRFTSSISKTAADWDKVVEYGTILLPTADLCAQRELVIGATYNDHAVAKVPAVNTYAEDDASVTFTAVLVDIAEANYARSYTARAYAILEDGSVVYGDTFSVRSIYEVAKNGIASGTASDAELEIFQGIVDVVDGVVAE